MISESKYRQGPQQWKRLHGFLDVAIDRPLHIDNFEPLCKLLTVMTDEVHLNNDSLEQLATEIKQEVDKETSLTTMKGTARGYHMKV